MTINKALSYNIETFYKSALLESGTELINVI